MQLSALPPLHLLALCVALVSAGPSPGSFEEAGDTKVSAMMMFLGNQDKVYILDKAENNSAQINGHPAWGSAWDIKSHQTDVMDVKTNVFCASGMHLPNGSYATFGGNKDVSFQGKSRIDAQNANQPYIDAYQDGDGSTAIRVLNPCTAADNMQDPKCQWFDNPAVLAMQKKRWYSAAEPLANGTVVMIGGFVDGGYINRQYPNVDPSTNGAEPTYEFYPSNGQPAQVMQFMLSTSGLNAYAHTFLMASGKMFVQANVSTMLWDYNTNTETPLPSMPNNVVRVYPASGAVAMLPLTPANQYIPTILFCGGSDIPEDKFGDYGRPNIETYFYPASKDCQRITPEPNDGSQPAYTKDDDMLDGRTMGQFVILPTGKLLVVNGGANGTAGYADGVINNGQGGAVIPKEQMPYSMSLAAQPVLKPALYDPNAAAGSRWTDQGFQASNIPRLYHSSAILLPDASVLIAGSNPNPDVDLNAFFKTTYTAEIWYPPYFSASTRPSVTGIPDKLSYGGNSFDLTLSSSSYAGKANDAADNTTVVLVRGGWTTHGMNMGQRMLQLKNTYEVKSDGSIVLHCAQMPPNANIFQPGPALMFVVVNGVPSTGKYVIVGSGSSTFENQALGEEAVLPQNVRLDSASGQADGSKTNADGSGKTSGSKTGAVVGGVVGAVVVLSVIAAVAGILVARRRRTKRSAAPSAAYAMSAYGGAGLGMHQHTPSDAGSFRPLISTDSRTGSPAPGHWRDGSQLTLGSYRDDVDGGGHGQGHSMSRIPSYDSYDPYAGHETQRGYHQPGTGIP